MAKILLVEDNEMNRDMLSRRSTKKGFEVVIAVDGQEGVEQKLSIASRALERVAESAGGVFDAAIKGLDRAVSEVIEGIEGVSDATRSFDLDPAQLEMVEDRLFALREAGRKHELPLQHALYRPPRLFQ